ncbi:MAG: hypothetical protein KBG20_04915 [Caldilineaceae bacterium]|nr:hypothetical protein [Caldilineaceae bacterium]MBP8107312.1 hypothetical protein [Caldilineaceae bacterium]MBP8121685.1 hypothetical protein [Caldilineaceae bacterium]MBP9071615.1 hypothetical protein [Caldilineaceae bacterium]
MKNKRTIIGMMAWLLAFAVLGLMGLSAPVMAAPAAPLVNETELTGPVQMRPTDSVGDWTVAGITVTVNSATVIEERVGPALVGAWVKVEGAASGGVITAHRLKVMPAQASVKLEGMLDALDATSAMVDGIGLGVNAATLLAGGPTVGQPVEVRAAIQADGSLLALRIQSQTPDTGGNGDDPSGPPELGNSETELRGVIQSLPVSGTVGVWQVSGITVTVAMTTEINTNAGPILVGGWIKVKGAGDGSGGLMAREAKVVDTGTVHKLAGILAELTDTRVTIDGITVAVNSATVIDGAPTVGQRVEVLSQLQADETLLAVKINAGQQGDPAPNPDGTVEFVGTVEILPASGLVGQWVVSGQTFTVTATTEVDQSKGAVAVGVRVKVHAVRESDTSLTAVEIKVLANGGSGGNDDSSGNYIKFTGLVESLPASGLIGEWVVAGRTISVTANTQIDEEDAAVAVGVLVKVEGYRLADGTVRAQEIEVKSAGNGQPNEGTVHLVGQVEARPDGTLLGTWTIAGRTVEVVTATVFDESHGPAALGVRVKVEGTEQADGSVLAAQIKTLGNDTGGDGGSDSYAKFKGTVVSIPATPDRVGQWQIRENAGVTLTINVLAETYMDETGGPIVVGSFVEVEGTVAADGSVVAAKIELKIPGECDCNELEFVGFVDSAPGSADGQGAWVIRSGMGLTRTVIADAATQFKSGIPVAGDRVEVHATVQADGSLLASKINKESEGGGGGGVEFTALIVSFPAGLVGTWQVGDKTVMASNGTNFDQKDGPFAVGVLVEVKGMAQADGTIVAQRIESKDNN